MKNDVKEKIEDKFMMLNTIK